MVLNSLQDFIENHFQSCVLEVSIVQMATTHRRMFNCKPCIAVDGMCLLYRLQKMDNMEWVYGGQWKKYVQNIQTFVQRFSDEDIELVFFFDGETKVENTEKWIKDKEEKLKEIKNIFEHISLNQRLPNYSCSHLPTSMSTFLRYVLKNECNCKVVNSIVDVRKEVAKLALEPGCFAVLAEHNDYIIFDTKPYLSLAHLKLGPLTTLSYNRHAIAQSLRLRMDLMPLFACFLGNQYVTVDDLKVLHSTVTESYTYTDIEVIQKVAQFVIDYPWLNLSDTRYLEATTQFLTSYSLSLSNLNNGLLYYQVSGHSVDELSECVQGNNLASTVGYIRQMHRDCQLNAHIYPLLCGAKFLNRECLEDEAMTGLLPSAIIFENIRMKCYFRLFLKEDMEVEEFRVIQPAPVVEKVKPTGMAFDMPLGKKINPFYALPRKVRWFNFLSTLETKLNQGRLLSLPHHRMTLACIVNFLLSNPVGEPRLFPWEVDALIAQAVSPLAGDLDAISDLQVPYVDARGVHLATIVLQGLATILDLCQLCGEPFASKLSMPWLFFDGKLFHYLYIKAKHGASMEELTQNNRKSVQEFIQLRSTCISGTYIVKERYKEEA